MQSAEAKIVDLTVSGLQKTFIPCPTRSKPGYINKVGIIPPIWQMQKLRLNRMIEQDLNPGSLVPFPSFIPITGQNWTRGDLGATAGSWTGWSKGKKNPESEQRTSELEGALYNGPESPGDHWAYTLTTA